MTSKQIDIATLEMLTPGSTWRRANGKEVRYLFTVNENLPAKMADEYPPLVVYADGDDNILAVPLETFLNKRDFFNVDPFLEKRLGDLLTITESSDEVFDLDGDDNLLVEDDDAPSASAGDESVDGTEQAKEFREVNTSVTFMRFNNATLPIIVEPEQLSEAVEGYAQAPLIDLGLIQHTLIFRAMPGISKDTLFASFSPVKTEENAIFIFNVVTEDGVLTIDWDAFVNIYPLVRGNQTYYQAVFTSEDASSVKNEPQQESAVTTLTTTSEAVTNVVGILPDGTVANVASNSGVVSNSVGQAPTTITQQPPTVVDTSVVAATPQVTATVVNTVQTAQ